MPGDDMLRITIEVGRRRDTPLGSEFKVTARRVAQIELSASSLEYGAVQGEAVMQLHRMCRELIPEGRW